MIGSAVVSAILWSLRQHQLEPPIDVVGLPSWADVDFEPAFLAYRLAIWQFPLTAGVLFGVLSVIASRRGWAEAPGSHVERPQEAPARSAVETPEDLRVTTSSGLARLAPVALLVIVVASATGDAPGRSIDARGLLTGAAYLAAIGVAALLAVRLRAERASLETVRDSLALVNVVSAPLLIALCLWLFAHSTVTVSNAGERTWPWIPLWLALLVGLAVTAAVLRAVKRRSPLALERRVIAFGVGAALVYVITTVMVGSVGAVSGFDDMMGIAGAEQLRDGAFPWRDVLMIHGVFEDSLRSLAGFELFGHSIWGAQAAYFALWEPLGWVGLYVLAMWGARRRGMTGPALFLAVVLLASHVELPARWVMAAPVFLLLGVALRRGGRGWTAILTIALFIEAVLVPEASFQVIAVGVVLLLADLREQQEARSRWRLPSRFATFFATGAVCGLVLAGYLALHGALDDFLRYYVIFGPGHTASGFRPIGPYTTTPMMVSFVACVALVGATLCWAVYRAFRPEPVSADEWLILAAALFAGMYGEKALGRFDSTHLEQSIAMTLPLVLLCGRRVLAHADDALRHRLARRSPGIRRRALGSAMSTAFVVVVLVADPSIARSVWQSPSNNTSAVSAHQQPGFGFTTASAADVAMISDLRKVVERLGGPDARVFDFSNSPGIFYFLMGLRSPTPYYHVSMAIPENAQRALIQDLERERPAIVAFDAARFGLSTWDSVINPVRHSLVSRYLLDGWRPIVRSHGVLFMLRNDLQPLSQIDAPGLTEPADTTWLHSSTPACDWGHVPNFLPTPVAGHRQELALSPARRARQFSYDGWAWNGSDQGRVERVVVAVGQQVVGILPPSPPRGELATDVGDPAATSAGFHGSVATVLPGRAEAYAILANGEARPVDQPARQAPPSLSFGDGSVVRVVNTPVEGEVEDRHRGQVRLSEIVIPPDHTFRDRTLATFSSSGSEIGRSTVTLYDAQNSPTSGGPILFRVLPVAGPSVDVRVGSCLQWRAYAGQRILLAQHGGGPIDRVTLTDFAAD